MYNLVPMFFINLKNYFLNGNNRTYSQKIMWLNAG